MDSAAWMDMQRETRKQRHRHVGSRDKIKTRAVMQATDINLGHYPSKYLPEAGQARPFGAI